MVDGEAGTKSPSREKLHVACIGRIGRGRRLLTVSMKCCRHSWMVRAVFPTPPSPSTTILCGVVNLPAIVGFVGRETREGLMWPCGRANQRGSLQESSVVWLRFGWVGGLVGGCKRRGKRERMFEFVAESVCVRSRRCWATKQEVAAEEGFAVD